MDDNRPVLIDLDLTRDDDLLADADAVAGRPVSLRRLRLTALALGVALLLAVGGSAPPDPPPLDQRATRHSRPARGLGVWERVPALLYVTNGSSNDGLYSNRFRLVQDTTSAPEP
jgi:hypothetical protein